MKPRRLLVASLIFCASSLSASPGRADDEVVGPPRPPPATTTRVHVRFPTGERLPYLEMWTREGWTLACKAPCDLELPTDARYRVRGRTGDAGGSFTLPSADHVRIDAAVGNAARAGWGLLALSGSAVSLGAAGGIALPSGEEKTSRVIVGVALALLGLSLGYIGFSQLLGVSTTADVVPTSSAPSTSSGTHPRSTGGVRWNGASLAF